MDSAIGFLVKYLIIMGKTQDKTKSMERLCSRKDDLREFVVNRLNELGIRPNENLGQHFLVDGDAIDTLTNSVVLGAAVIEVGAGVGQLTEALAERANEVVSVEIDKRYRPILTQIERTYPNVRIVYGDILALEISALVGKHKGQTQIVASLPYYITEPFLHKITEFPMHNATLVVGKRLMYAMEAISENDPSFGQLTLLTQTFFYPQVIRTIEKKKFFPVPRTDSAIIRLTPKTREEINLSRRDYLLKRLFVTARYSPLTKNALKEGLIELARLSGETLTQNQARAIISEMDVPNDVLDRPFQQLSNENLKALSRALR